jgi:uncharacterized protein YfeS
MSGGFDLDVVVTRFGVHPGTTAATAPVVLLLHEGLVSEDFGTAFDCIRIDLHFRHEGPPPGPFGPTDIARYHAYLETFPKITLRTKAKRIDALWAMSLSFEAFAPGQAPSVTGFEQLSAEVLLALEAIRPRVTKNRDLRFAPLIAKVQATIAAVPREEEAFRARIAEARSSACARELAIRAADPWAALAIDWTAYHPSARALLDDPFFWDPADDHAPVGNDTGADILESYRSWRRRRKKDVAGAVALVEEVLEEWGMRETGGEKDRLVRDEAFIALAFAQAMLDGTITSDVASRALAAIDRQLPRHATWRQPEIRRGTLEKMRAKLEALRATK